jgi:hypothetical protein
MSGTVRASPELMTDVNVGPFGGRTLTQDDTALYWAPTTGSIRKLAK